MTSIVCRAGADLSGPWLRLKQQGSEWLPEAHYNDLRQAIDGTLLGDDFTFTTRAIEDAIAACADTPDQMERLGLDSHATILLPEGGGVENKWVTLHRVPMTGAIVATGILDRFRPQKLKDQVLAYFERAQWRSFAPQKVSERYEPVGQQPQRPPWARELLVRHGWSARAIAPDAFAPIRSGHVLPLEVEAKRLAKLPQNKAAARRLKHQEADVRFKAEAAERARLRGEVA